MASDWAAIKLDYIHSSLTLREVADKHGIKAAGVMRRAAKESWDAERKQKSAEVSKVAGTSLIDIRASELAIYNAQDLDAAKAIREKALAMLDVAAYPGDVKSIAAAVDTASKVARLALGVATENATITTNAYSFEVLRAGEELCQKSN